MVRLGVANREGGVYADLYALRMRKFCPECGVHMHVVLYVCVK